MYHLIELNSAPSTSLLAPKICTLAITIYHYCSFDLAAMIAKNCLELLETVSKENNTLLKREDFRENFHEMHHGIVTN